ncbi:uncharacterized protein LOC143018209 isoform X1 [Oratosquilla oratoria]|uniref:uncharacterized protein LOC143018209 isoform X1 n=1 Tax=Oratosquilla oratoria TaxID=337810 RepID=UPI003F76012D
MKIGALLKNLAARTRMSDDGTDGSDRDKMSKSLLDLSAKERLRSSSFRKAASTLDIHKDDQVTLRKQVGGSPVVQRPRPKTESELILMERFRGTQHGPARSSLSVPSIPGATSSSRSFSGRSASEDRIVAKAKRSSTIHFADEQSQRLQRLKKQEQEQEQQLQQRQEDELRHLFHQPSDSNNHHNPSSSSSQSLHQKEDHQEAQKQQEHKQQHKEQQQPEKQGERQVRHRRKGPAPLPRNRPKHHSDASYFHNPHRRLALKEGTPRRSTSVTVPNVVISSSPSTPESPGKPEALSSNGCQSHEDSDEAKVKTHALKSLSRSTPAMSPTGSPRQSDTETGPRSAKGTKKFHRHFTEAPPTERVLNYYACALLSEILLQGTLFITPNFFAFYSKIFGHVSKVLIPINQVSAIQKERTAKIIPNAVGLSTLDGKSYVFGSLLSRDSTYKLMNHMWKKTQKMVDSDSEPPSAQAEMADEAEEEEDSGSGSVESLLEEEEEEDEDKKERARPTTLPTWGGGGVGGGGVEVDSITPTSTNPPRGVQTSPVGPEIPVVNCTNPAASLGANPSACATPGRTSEVWGSGGKQRPEDQKISPEDTTVLSWFPIIWVFKVWCRVGSVPLRLVGQGLRELCALSRTSLLLLLSTLLLLLLFASASFMLHRVDILSRQMLQQDRHEQLEGMYEEVLRMQQRLHTAATTEVEKTLGVQLKHIATVRQSLEALAALFNREARHAAPQIQENT